MSRIEKVLKEISEFQKFYKIVKGRKTPSSSVKKKPMR